MLCAPDSFPVPPYPMDEEERLRALQGYRILDTDPEPQFDRIASLAKRRFSVPLAFITFVDGTRAFLKARCDFAESELPRAISFCAYAILSDDVLVVLDATKDERFIDNPFVVGDQHIRFYAGAPLVTASGFRLGTICLFDTKARQSFGGKDRQDLADFASIIADHLEMRLIVGSVHDEIEIRKAAEAREHKLALHDSLTGLPNRAYLQKVIVEGLPAPRKKVLAAFAADLDEFKTVNDTFGHYAGDELLCRTADSMKAMLGDRAFVARISGDEFVALVDGDTREAILDLANTIVEKTADPIPMGGRMISVGVSIGVAFEDSDTPDTSALLKNADFALCFAKSSGRRRTVVFDERMALETRRVASLRADLINAIKEKSIRVFFQPIHLTPEGSMIGVEALARWTHPTRGVISPAEFIALAEESGQILELGDYVLRQALGTARGWGDIFVSVNLSPVQFKLIDLASSIAAILAETGFPASRLHLEITEGVLLDDLQAARRQIRALQNIGVSVALDDFGSGYSSLTYLADLPFDRIKIDQSLVQGARHDEKRRAIIKHIVAMARDLNLRITAEGVESREDADFLSAAGCTSLQGHYFGRAMPDFEITDRLRLGRPAA